MPTRRHFSGRVSVDVYVSEIMDELDDDDLIAELERRGKSVRELELTREYVVEAYEALQSKRPEEALALLDRALAPSVFNPNAKTGALMVFADASVKAGDQ